MRKWARAGVTMLALAFVAAQFVPVDRSNPPVESDVVAPPEVRAILRRACYDCHSHETVWPGYSRVAPVSWLLARDVREGRRELNFSRWNRLDEKMQAKKKDKAWEEISGGDMPLWFYTPLHPSARLSEADKAILHAWLLPEAAPEAGRSPRFVEDDAR